MFMKKFLHKIYENMKKLKSNLLNVRIFVYQTSYLVERKFSSYWHVVEGVWQKNMVFLIYPGVEKNEKIYLTSRYVRKDLFN